MNRVESIRQIHEGQAQVKGSEAPARGNAVMAEDALVFRQETLLKVAVDEVEKDASENLPGDVQQGDAGWLSRH
nr:unnamed protein product [Spirometra erinaceieuropaei]